MKNILPMLVATSLLYGALNLAIFLLLFLFLRLLLFLLLFSFAAFFA